MSVILSRLHFIDFARTYAVFLALLAHSLETTGVIDRLGSDSLYVRQFTRTATPMFVFMFGFMIEFVYATRARASGVESIRWRLQVRSFQCYVGYCLTSLCTWIGGYQSAYKFLASLAFFGNSRFGNILRVYAVILLLTPLLVQLRLRFGIRFVALCLAGVLLTFPWIVELKAVDFGMFNNPLNVLFGFGPPRRGPSVWHSLAFVLAGMLLASSLTGGAATLRSAFSRFYVHGLCLIAACALFWSVMVHDSPAEAWVKFAEFTYRGNNMPGYYLIGIVTSVVTITLCSLAIGTRELPRAVRFFLPLGLSSLLSYTTGNVLLNLSGSAATRIDPAIYMALFFAGVLLITKYIERMPYYGVANELLHLRLPRRASPVPER